MKKLLGILAIGALVTSALAQGTVTFQNSNLGYVNKWTSATDSTAVKIPTGSGYVQLISAPAGSALANTLGTLDSQGFAVKYTTLASFLAANGNWSVPVGTATTTPFAATPFAGLAGCFSGGNATLNGVAEGANANYMAIGWTGAYANYDAAYAAAFLNVNASFIGASAVFTTVTGAPNTTPSGTPVNLKATFTGMTLAPVIIPEPASFALAGLGLAALLAFRRRS